jgi:hypothetical protein
MNYFTEELETDNNINLTSVPKTSEHTYKANYKSAHFKQW